MSDASLDLDHLAMPDMRVRSRFEGHVILRRCGCGAPIWRTAERFVWSHSSPPRKELHP